MHGIDLKPGQRITVNDCKCGRTYDTLAGLDQHVAKANRADKCHICGSLKPTPTSICPVCHSEWYAEIDRAQKHQVAEDEATGTCSACDPPAPLPNIPYVHTLSPGCDEWDGTEGCIACVVANTDKPHTFDVWCDRTPEAQDDRGRMTVYPCPYCPKKWGYAGELRGHITRMHPHEFLDPNTTDRQFLADVNATIEDLRDEGRKVSG